MGGSIAELIVIFAIVGTAAVLGARTFYRMMTGKGKRQCCGCGLCTRTDAKKQGS